MRITTSIMQNNSLTNLNNNKILQDNLTTQIATKSKITRPSDDPVIAIRALRLRTNLSEITQYLDKNVEDADSWLTLTETALGSVGDLLEEVRKECQKGGGDESLSSESRSAILEQLQGLKEAIYATGDADNAGRSLFTGYRTETPLCFQKADNDDPYVITEEFNRKNVDTINYVNTGGITDVNVTNYNTTVTTTENDISASSIARIRLSYDTLDSDATAPTVLRLNGIAFSVGDTISYVTDSTTVPPTTMDISYSTVSTSAVPSPYETMTSMNDIESGLPALTTGQAIFVPETGELLLSNNLNTVIQKDNSTTVSIEYGKRTWEKGDLRPEHYFECSETLDDGSVVAYSGEEQYMSYDVGYNQKIQVNTLPSEVFTHDIGRMIDELMEASKAVAEIEETITALEAMVGDSNYDQTAVTARLDAAKKAKTLLSDKEQKLYAAAEDSTDTYITRNSLATTNVGNRSARLELIKSRLTSQQTTFQGLVTENEGADVEKAAVQLKSAQTTYDAALAATSKILQTSLMDYI